MTDFVLSAHLEERAIEREISLDIIEAVLATPDKIVDDESGEPMQKIYQSIVAFPEKGTYLVRVFVNCKKQPNVVKSVYRTSKIARYI